MINVGVSLIATVVRARCVVCSAKAAKTNVPTSVATDIPIREIWPYRPTLEWLFSSAALIGLTWKRVCNISQCRAQLCLGNYFGPSRLHVGLAGAAATKYEDDLFRTVDVRRQAILCPPPPPSGSPALPAAHLPASASSGGSPARSPHTACPTGP